MIFEMSQKYILSLSPKHNSGKGEGYAKLVDKIINGMVK